jgi:hypothetical protein
MNPARSEKDTRTRENSLLLYVTLFSYKSKTARNHIWFTRCLQATSTQEIRQALNDDYQPAEMVANRS